MAAVKFHSASVILIRKQPVTLPSHKDPHYQVLLLHRTEGTYVGGNYAFAGGKVEKQDLKERWEPYRDAGVVSSQSLGLADFTLRVTALRELFEECNLLLATNMAGSVNYSETLKESKTALLDDLTRNFEGDFAGFCAKHGKTLQVD